MVRGWSLWAMGGLVCWVSGCETAAHGISACREIEAARCAAAVGCGYPNEEQCEQFAHDNCLHGTLADGFDSLQVQGCRAALESSAQCALQSGQDTALGACEPSIGQSGRGGTTACEAILRPELLQACAFLVEAAPQTPPDGVESEAETVRGDAGS